MKFEYFIANRLIKQKEKTFARPVVRIAITSIALSIAVMLIAISVLQGFKKEIKNKIAGFGSHVQIVPYGLNRIDENQTIKLSKQETSFLSRNENINTIAPTYTRSGAIINKDDFQSVILKGIDKDYNTTFFKENLVEGKFIQLNKTSKQEVLVSKTIADKLKLKVGEKIKIYFYIDKSYRAKNFTISGIYDTGLGEYDERFIICDMNPLHSIFSAQENEYTSYEIMLKDFSRLDNTAEDIYYNVDRDKSVLPVTELEPNLFAWLNLLDSNVVMIILIMMLVSVVTMSSVILIMIFEKKTMIGILKSFGTENKTIIKIFLYRAGYVTLKGMLYGNIFAITLELVQKYSHLIKLDKESYYLTSVPIDINILAILLIDIGAFIVCLVCLILPAKSISKISPVKNLKFQ